MLLNLLLGDTDSEVARGFIGDSENEIEDNYIHVLYYYDVHIYIRPYFLEMGYKLVGCRSLLSHLKLRSG